MRISVSSSDELIRLDNFLSSLLTISIEIFNGSNCEISFVNFGHSRKIIFFLDLQKHQFLQLR